MAVYILNFLTIPIYNFLIRDRKKFVIVMTLQIFLILALRDTTVGMDLRNYAGGYEFISSLGFTDMLSRLRIISVAELVYPYAYESGYVVLCWIFGKLHFSFYFFLVLHAAFCMTSFGLFIYRYSRAPWLSFAMFCALGYFEYSFGILRQILAICILLFAVPLIEKKKPIPFFLLVLLSFTIHRVAIVFAVLYLAYYITVTKLVYLINAAFWVVFTALSPFLFRFVIAKVLTLLDKEGYTAGSFEWSHRMTLLLAIAVIAFFTLDFASLKDKRNSIIAWGFLLIFPIQILGMNNDTFARMVFMYLIFVAVFVPNVIADYKKKPMLREIGGYALWFVMFLWMVYQFHSSQIVPYEFIFAS